METTYWKPPQHPRQGPGLVKRLQEQVGHCRNERSPYPTCSYLKGFKQRRDLAKFLESSSGQLGWGWMGGREIQSSNPGSS